MSSQLTPSNPTSQSSPPLLQAKKSRLPIILGVGALVLCCCGVAAVLLLGGGLLWGNPLNLPSGSTPSSVDTGTLPTNTPTPFPEVEKPPLIELTPQDSTDIAADGQPVTDTHAVSAVVPGNSLVDASVVHMVANELPAAFDQELEAQEGWKRTSPVYSLELDEGGDMIGNATLTFPASGPDDRVAVLLDRRYFVVLYVLPEDGKLTVQATVKPGGDEVFEGEGEMYFRVSKAGSAWNEVQGALASMFFASLDPLTEAQLPAMQAAAPCEYHNWRIYTECWNADHTFSFTTSMKLDPSDYPAVEKFLNKAADIMSGYRGLLFTHATPTTGEPVYIEIDPNGGDPRYTPGLIGVSRIYLGWRTVLRIDEMVEQQTLAHELFHWVERHTYYMMSDGNVPVLYWHLEVRAEAASLLVNPAYAAARLPMVGAVMQNNSGGILGWQKAPFDWDSSAIYRPIPDVGRYVQGMVLRLGLCDGPSCIINQQGFVDDINAGGHHWGIDAYRHSLENTARYLLGGIPFTSSDPADSPVDLSAPILQTGRGYGDFIHASQNASALIKYLDVYDATNLKKNTATGEVSIEAVIASGGLYPLRVSNGADVPSEDSTRFNGDSLQPNVPYALHIDAGVAFYYRVGTDEVQYHPETQVFDYWPISSDSPVKFQSPDKTVSDVPGTPSIRIVAINPTEAAVTLRGSFKPLPPVIIANPDRITLENPKDEVKLQLTVSQIAMSTTSFTAVWDYGDGSALERVKASPDSKREAVIAVKHVFQSVGTKEVRVYFEDENDKTLAWDTVIIPIGGKIPTNFNSMGIEMNIAGSFVRSTRLYNVKIRMTSTTTFDLDPGETRVQGITGGEIASDGKSISFTLTYLPDPDFGVVGGCPNVTIFKNIPLVQQDSYSKVFMFAVYGWDNILASIQDTYPWAEVINGRPTGAVACMTTEGWSQNFDIQPNPTLTISLAYP
jgi:hypothetical protein